MLPLRARRVGLLSPFMGVLGAIAGALIVFPLAGISTIVQAFWLGALGALFLGRWPGGRGPAWETGEAEPWPTAAQRRGARAGERDEPAGSSIRSPAAGAGARAGAARPRASGGRSAERSGDGRRVRQALERGLHVRLRELRVLQLPGQVALVGGHVEVAVAR